MALIQCGECGRTISDKASACMGCGAPVTVRAVFGPDPASSSRRLPSRTRLAGRAAAWALALLAGVLWSNSLRTLSGSAAAIAAALLVVIGLCGIVVTALQLYGSRKTSNK